MTLHLKCPTFHANVGDVISEPIARHYLTQDLRIIRRSPGMTQMELLDYPHENLLLVGSIAEWSDARSHLCGVGMLKADNRIRFKPKKVHAVRGPLSREIMLKQAIDTPEIYGDPGVLMPHIIPIKGVPLHEYGLIPHYMDKKHAAVQAWKQQGVHIIDVFLPPAEFMRELFSCRVIFSSSLHGIILAHAYGRPALWVTMGEGVIGNGFKFHDYYASLGIAEADIQRVSIQGFENRKELAARATWYPVESLQKNLLDALAEVKADLKL
jgi:pyruvyltransferase